MNTEVRAYAAGIIECCHCEEMANIGLVDDGSKKVKEEYNSQLNQAIKWMIAFKTAQAQLDSAKKFYQGKNEYR